MALGFIKVWLNWTERTSKLKPAEKGRLIDALTLYARGEDVDELLSGNEQYLFPMFQEEIDRDREHYAELSSKRAEAGRAGGIQRQANASKCQQMEAKASKSSSISKKKIEEENSKDLDDDDTARARDPIFGYAMDALSYLSPTAMQELASYRADIGDELTRYAIDEAVDHGGRTWAYTRTILESIVKGGYKTVGEAKAAKQKRTAKVTQMQGGKTNPARDYEQRDYSTKADDYKPMSLEELVGGGTR